MATQLLQVGVEYLKLSAAASTDHGIKRAFDEEADRYVEVWNHYLEGCHKVVKFVPASGAASRMFKDVFAFIDGDADEPQTEFEQTFLQTSIEPHISANLTKPAFAFMEKELTT